MNTVQHQESTAVKLENPAVELFQQDWKIYRKLVENNYLFHTEAYDRLHTLLADTFSDPFSFLDIACGDASAAVDALKGTQVAWYYGVDLSRAALEVAGENLKQLRCPMDLREADLAAALRDWREPVDVVWIGLSLHHFGTGEKLELMREARRIVGSDGLFAIYENASPDGEDRDGWLRRWDLQKPLWTAYSPEEWGIMQAHVRGNDFPETSSGWHALGREAGFGEVREVYTAPSDLFRLYSFRA
ncbi:MAG TPA: class I SAM-dependent methyltransferase [Arsenicitalea sp.]|jgi:SAM-dependent methyltransferase|nr:class I SAM-dependent methyltransferase [Arsenicitalea sp.]